jgi:hypothetical protein
LSVCCGKFLVDRGVGAGSITAELPPWTAGSEIKNSGGRDPDPEQ